MTTGKSLRPGITEPAKTRIALERKLHLTVLLVFLSAAIWAQDIHYSQFHNAPLVINPALTGVFRGDVRFSGNFRHQWPRPPVEYTTFTAMADMKFLPDPEVSNNVPGFFSGGLNFNYDQAGDSKLSLASLGLNGSYTRMLDKRWFASVGVQLAGSQRRFDTDDLFFDDQYVPGSPGPGQPTKEAFPNTSNFFLDFSAGFNIRYQNFSGCTNVDLLRDRTRVDFGLGIFHLNRPDQSFIEDEKVEVFTRYTPYALGLIKLSPDFDLAANVMLQFQGPYREYVGAIGPKFHIDKTPGDQVSLQLLLGLRLNDEELSSWFPSIEVFYKNWRAGFSYDFDVSDFDVATDGIGGPELTLRYILIKPRYNCRICPLI